MSCDDWYCSSACGWIALSLERDSNTIQCRTPAHLQHPVDSSARHRRHRPVVTSGTGTAIWWTLSKRILMLAPADLQRGSDAHVQQTSVPSNSLGYGKVLSPASRPHVAKETWEIGGALLRHGFLPTLFRWYCPSDYHTFCPLRIFPVKKEITQIEGVEKVVSEFFDSPDSPVLGESNRWPAN